MIGNWFLSYLNLEIKRGFKGKLRIFFFFMRRGLVCYVNEEE